MVSDVVISGSLQHLVPPTRRQRSVLRPARFLDYSDQKPRRQIKPAEISKYGYTPIQSTEGALARLFHQRNLNRLITTAVLPEYVSTEMVKRAINSEGLLPASLRSYSQNMGFNFPEGSQGRFIGIKQNKDGTLSLAIANKDDDVYGFCPGNPQNRSDVDLTLTDMSPSAYSLYRMFSASEFGARSPVTW